MDWARILAYVTGLVDQELLARTEYLAAENRILKAQLKGRLKQLSLLRIYPSSSCPVGQDKPAEPDVDNSCTITFRLVATAQAYSSRPVCIVGPVPSRRSPGKLQPIKHTIAR